MANESAAPNVAGILLSEGDRNVFIAECKFWKGPKAFGEAIDRLFGYQPFDGLLEPVERDPVRS